VAFPKAEFRRALIRWYRKNGRDLPWRHTRDPYAILVSELMLQQTQVVTVMPYYNDWLRRFPNFASLACACENDVLHAWQGLGYYARARNLHATAMAVVKRYGERFPRSVEEMQQLPGIGKYTAHAVASLAFDQPAPIVEANSARVLARIFDFRRSIDRTAGQKVLWQHAAALVPKRSARIYNSALIDLGALICLRRRPRCGACPVKRFCRAVNPQTLPVRKSPPRTKSLTEKHAFVVYKEKILLQQSRERWRGMWILPPLQTTPVNQQAIYKSIFPFTNHRVALNVYAARQHNFDRSSQRWIEFDSLQAIPIPSPHRKALQSLLKRDRM